MKDGKSTEFKHHHDTLEAHKAGGHAHHSVHYNKHKQTHTSHKEHIVKHFKGK